MSGTEIAAMWLDWYERPIEPREMEAAELASCRADGGLAALRLATRPERVKSGRHIVPRFDTDRMIKLYATRSMDAVAHEMGCNPHTVRRRLVMLGLNRTATETRAISERTITYETLAAPRVRPAFDWTFAPLDLRADLAAWREHAPCAGDAAAALAEPRHVRVSLRPRSLPKL